MKQNLRKKLLEKRKFLSDAYFQMADERICMLAAELPEFQQAEVVFCYVGMEGEVSTCSLLEKVLAEGKRLGVPRCEKKGVMSAASHCRAFRYDPLKRVPPRPAKADFSKLKDEDFRL